MGEGMITAVLDLRFARFANSIRQVANLAFAAKA
jgi:hypothetical protein